MNMSAALRSLFPVTFLSITLENGGFSSMKFFDKYDYSNKYGEKLYETAYKNKGKIYDIV